MYMAGNLKFLSSMLWRCFVVFLERPTVKHVDDIELNALAFCTIGQVHLLVKYKSFRILLVR